MNRNTVLEFNLRELLPPEQVLRSLRVDESAELYEDVTNLLDGAYALGKPRGVFRECYVESRDGDQVTVDGVLFQGALVAEKLTEVHRVFPFVATCGPELAAWADAQEDVILSFYASSFNQLAAGAAGGRLKTAVIEHSGVEKLAALNPGSLPGWPLRQQVPLFRLLDGVTGDIGVRLTPSCLMVPIKSVSGILFPSSSEWFNCMRCPRLNCPGRKAAFVG